jgi:uncharacterized protein with von Willebrand factor type A (vWA) domain
MNHLRSLLLDLFYYLRDSGNMSLTIVQFDLLCEAIEKGYGIQDWEGLRRICRLLWVKSYATYERQKFEVAFDRYTELCRDALIDALEAKRYEENRGEESPGGVVTVELGQYPQMPRKLSNIKAAKTTLKLEEQQQKIIGVKVDNIPSKESALGFVLNQLPIDTRMVQTTWQRLRPASSEGQLQELDFEKTLLQIGQTGILSEIVMRSADRRRGDLLLLIDDDNPMLPFRPAIQPMIDAIEEGRVRPSVIYRFSTYPVDYFYQWQRQTEAIAVSTVLSRLHRQRTLAVIVSDGGAASRTYNPARIQRTGAFLEQLIPCVRDVLWLNPLPEERWEGTSASAIAAALNGRMVALSGLRSRQRRTEGEVQLWSLTA